MAKEPKISALEKAAILINAGETIKAKLKDAMDALNREYDKLRDANHMAQIKYADGVDALSKNFSPERGEFFRQNDVPFGLHQVKADKHKRIFVQFSGEDVWREVETLINTRTALKELPIVTKEPKGESPEEKIKKTVLSTFKSESERVQGQFNWAKAVMDEFAKMFPNAKGLPVSVSHVYCSNYHGTSWLRVDWYLSGQKTRFNIIAAAAQEHNEKKEGKK